MGLSVGLVATALSSNIPTDVLVDCCFLVSSAVFQLFVFFSGFTSLNFAGPIQQSSRIFIGRRVGVPAATGGWHSNAPPPPWRRAWAVSRCPRRLRGGFSGSSEGAIAQKADYLDEIIWKLMHPLNWTWFDCNDKTVCVSLSRFVDGSMRNN